MAEIVGAKDNFFKVGGTLGGDAASYIQRPLDKELLHYTLAREYCNVLAARQMGKSSLMVRTAEELRKQGVRTAVIDITSIGTQITVSEWYVGLVTRLASDLKLNMDTQAWWDSMESKSPVQRFSDFIRDVVLEKEQKPIVVFVDEIDSTLKLDFTDDFFAAIRAMYNARSRDEIYKKLTFVLLGVARPGDLIKDRTRTPYNIGVNIDVTDFEINELDSFRTILDEYFPNQGNDILEWVLNWTGGQPYLTQKLCSEVVENTNGSYTEEELSDLVEQLFLRDKARTETNLVTIRDRINNSPHATRMLRIYRRVLGKKRVVAEERSIEQNELKLTGLVKVNPQGTLQVRNRIYAHIFDTSWVRANMPVTPAQRLTVAMSIVAGLAIVFAGYFYYQQQNQTAEIQARTYIDNFNNSNSAEVRISSLAGLFQLGDQYTEQANGLFDALSQEQKLALFDLAIPANVGNELVVVIQNVYQTQANTSDGNEFLRAMGKNLEQTNASGATSLALEINTWLDARDAVTKADYQLAISLYTRAFDYSHERKDENTAILIERAGVYTELNQYANALSDYDNAVNIDGSRANSIQNTIFGNPKLADYWREHSTVYPSLLSAMALPTELPTRTPTLTPTPISNLAVAASIPPVKRILRNIGFDTYPNTDFTIRWEAGDDKSIVKEPQYSLSDGILRFEEPILSGNPWSDGQARLDSNFIVKEGNGYLLLYRTTDPGTQFLVTFEFGPWPQSNYRAFWFGSGQYFGGPFITVYQGSRALYFDRLNIQFQQNTWYYLFIRLYASNVETLIWRKDDPENVFVFRTDVKGEWTNENFIYHLGLAEGAIEIDEFQELEFSTSISLPLDDVPISTSIP